MIDFRLNTFVAVCRHMNFTRAAEELSITQPAVSQHIRYLEQQYQVKLFDYTNKKLVLTEAGRLLLDTTMTIVHDDIHLRAMLQELKGQKKTLTFGVTLTVGQFVMPQPVANYLKSHPETTVKMTVSNTKELVKKLNDGQIDFALVEGFFARNEYDSLIYSTEPYIPVCGKDYVPGKKLRRIEDTFGERIILREAGSGTREILERYLESRNFQVRDYRNIIEISNISAIKSLVELGCGITFLYETAVKEELSAGTLKKIPLEDFEVTHDFTFIWRKGSVFSEYYKELFDLLNLKDGFYGEI